MAVGLDADTQDEAVSSSWVDALVGRSPPVEPGLDLSGEILSARYRLVRELGRGGFGVVYRAHDEHVGGREVALKLLRTDRIAHSLRTLYYQRFLSEADVVSRLRHRGIVTVHDLGIAVDGVAAGRPYIVTELLSGRSLRAWSKASPALDVWLEVMAALGEALAHAHQCGVLHRDIKPENVVVLEEGPKLLDFGLAESAEHADHLFSVARARGPLAAAGTPGYMPPEQIAGQHQSAATDLFAWGVVMYESLSGVVPRAKGTPLKRLEAHRPDLPSGLAELIHRCIALSPRDRPSSAHDVARALSGHRRVLARIGRGGVVPTSGSADPPYPGLRPFESSESGRFFGRDDAVGHCFESLRSHRAWLALEAPSGRGKSSFLRAGLIPRLRACWLEDGEPEVIELRPSTSLARSLTGAVPGSRDAAHAIDLLSSRSAPLVLVVDQLEELSTQAADEHALALRLVRTFLAERSAPALLVTAVRSDLLDRLDALVVESRRAVRFRLPAIEGEALREIIEAPAALAGLHLEPGLVDRLTRDATVTPHALPLLADTLRALHERRHDGTLRLEDYHALGGLAGAARSWGEAILTAAPDRESLRAALLVAVAHDGTRARGRPITIDDLRQVVPDPVRLDAVRTLVTGRAGHRALLVEDDAGILTWVHESIIEAWPTLARWVAADRRNLVARTELEEAAQRWARDGRPADALVRGEQLAFFGSVPAPSAAGLELLAASRAAQRRRTVRTRAAVASAMLVLAIVAVVLALLNRRAEREREAAERALAATDGVVARQAFDGGARVRARASVRRALEGYDDLEARAIWWRLEQDPVFQSIDVPETYAYVDYGPRGISVANYDGVLLVDPISTAVRRIPRERLGTLWARFSPDQRSVVATTNTGSRVEWMLDDDRVIEHAGGGDWTHAQALSPDGRGLLSGHRSGAVRWTPLRADGERLAWTHGARVVGVSFSPDGTRVATLDAEGGVMIGDGNATRVRRLGGVDRHGASGQAWKQPLLYAAGDRLFVANRDGRTRVYSVQHDRLIGVLDGVGSAEGCLGATRDGAVVAVPAIDGTIRLWSAPELRLLASWRAHAEEVVCPRFERDGTVLVTTSLDRTIAVWNLRGAPSLVHRSPKMAAHPQYAPLSPDGRFYVPALGGDVQVRRVDGARLEGAPSGHRGLDTVVSIAADPTGTGVASSSSEGDLRLWDWATGRERVAIESFGSRVGVPSFSPDGTLVGATVDVRLYTLTASTGSVQEVTAPGKAADRSPLVWSPDGTRRAFVDAGGAVVLALGDRIVQLPTPPSAAINAIAWSPAGDRLAAAGGDRVVYLFDGAGFPIRDYWGRGSVIYGIAFDPTGREVMASGQDHLVRGLDLDTGLWRTVLANDERGGAVRMDATGRLTVALWDGRLRALDPVSGRVDELIGHRGLVNALDVDPRGRWAVSGGEDGTIRTWDLARAAPHWRWIVDSTDGAEVLTHAGWSVWPDGDAPPPSRAWRARAALSVRGQRRGDWACLLLGDRVEAWSLLADQAVGGAAIAHGARWVAAGSSQCWIAGRAGVSRWDRGGGLTIVEARGVTAFAHGDRDVVWANGPAVTLADEHGRGRLSFVHERPVTAVAVHADGLILGDATGRVVDVDTRGAVRLAWEGPVSPVTSLARVGRRLFASGHEHGELVLWSDDGARLHADHLHGAVESIRSRGARVTAVSELGTVQHWDVARLTEDWCATLRLVWRDAPVLQGGRWVTAPAPVDHPCARARPGPQEGEGSPPPSSTP